MKKMLKPEVEHIADKKEEQAKLVMAALDNGVITRSGISKVTGIKPWALALLLSENTDLYSSYKVRRRLIVHQAADNIVDIVNDKDHPSNYAASKHMITKYKSDFEDILDSQDDEEMAVEIPAGEIVNPVRITFTKRTRREESED